MFFNFEQEHLCLNYANLEKWKYENENRSEYMIYIVGQCGEKEDSASISYDHFQL